MHVIESNGSVRRLPKIILNENLTKCFKAWNTLKYNDGSNCSYCVKIRVIDQLKYITHMESRISPIKNPYRSKTCVELLLTLLQFSIIVNCSIRNSFEEKVLRIVSQPLQFSSIYGVYRDKHKIRLKWNFMY